MIGTYAKFPAIQLATLAYWCTILPLVAVHASYLISALNGQVEWCIPYVDSCTSISNAGRKHPAQIIFKSLLTCTAVLMFLYWLALAQWLKWLRAEQPKTLVLVYLMGTYAPAALILYCVTLGSDISQQKELRRIGIVLFFSFTALAHLLVVYQLKRAQQTLSFPLRRTITWQTGFSYLLVTMGVISGVLSGLASAWYRTIDNAIEWSFALPMILQFWLTGRMWKITGYQARLENTTDSG